jgi:hypothetical protein
MEQIPALGILSKCPALHQVSTCMNGRAVTVQDSTPEVISVHIYIDLSQPSAVALGRIMAPGRMKYLEIEELDFLVSITGNIHAMWHDSMTETLRLPSHPSLLHSRQVRGTMKAIDKESAQTRSISSFPSRMHMSRSLSLDG